VQGSSGAGGRTIATKRYRKDSKARFLAIDVI